MRSKGLFRHGRLLLLAALLAGGTLAYHTTGLGQLLSVEGLQTVGTEIRAAGWLGAASYLLLYVAVITLGLPNLPFQLAAGAIYGLWTAYALMFLGVNLGALAAFFLARFLGRKTIEDLWGHKLEGLNRRLEKGGFRLIFALRLIPLMPFNAINYASGISRMPITSYLAASLLGSPILTFLHVSIGSTAGQALSDASGRSWAAVATEPQILLPLALTGVVVALSLGVAGLRRRAQTNRANADTGRL